MRSILLLPLVAIWLETIDVCIWHIVAIVKDSVLAEQRDCRLRGRDQQGVVLQVCNYLL